MKIFLKKKYRALKEIYLNEIGYVVPEIYQSSFTHWGGGLDVQYIYANFFGKLPKNSSILIVGVMGGRDFFLCKNLGYDVTAVDIGSQPEIRPITFCNIEDTLPFPENTFDAVLIGEVLEHLKYDVKALEGVRRVLKPSGMLIVSLPFYNDWEDGHMRIHSPLSGRRLLELGGFKIIDYLERPGFLWLNIFNWIQHGLSLVSYQLRGKTLYSWSTNLIGRFEWFCGHRYFIRPIRKMSKHFGGYFLCKKSEDVLDHVAVNKGLYTDGQMGNNKR